MLCTNLQILVCNARYMKTHKNWAFFHKISLIHGSLSHPVRKVKALISHDSKHVKEAHFELYFPLPADPFEAKTHLEFLCAVFLQIKNKGQCLSDLGKLCKKCYKNA